MSEKSERLLAKFSSLQALYGEFHKNLKRNREFYDLKFGSDVIPPASQAKGFVPVIPPTARQAIDEAADHILYYPKLKIPARPTEAEQTTEQELAEKRRLFAASWWRQVTQRTNPLGDGRKILLNEGMIAVRSTLRWDLIPDSGDEEYDKALDSLGKYDFLWNVELLDNLTVFPDPSNHRDPQYCFVRYSLYAEEAKRLFPNSTGAWREMDDYAHVQYTEYWGAPKQKPGGKTDPGDYICWIEAEVVHEAENPYPYVPIAIEDSGYGYVHHLAKVEDKFRGFSEFTQDVFVAQARQWSAMEAVAELTAFSPLITRNMDETKIKTLSFEPGAVWPLEGSAEDPSSESVEFAALPAIPVTVPQLIGLTDRAANSTLKMEVLGGIPQEGVSTATEADTNQRNAAAKLQSPVAAMERLASKLTKWAFMDVDHTIGHAITIRGTSSDEPGEVKLSPRDISGFYECTAQLTTTDEDAIAQNKARFWLEMALRTPFLSYFTAMERGDIADNPQEEMLKRAAEEVFLSPEFRAIRTLTGAQSFGELAQMLQQLGRSAGSSNESAFPAGGGINAEQTLLDRAQAERDVTQGASQLRGF